jgi:predicted acyltransferase
VTRLRSIDVFRGLAMAAMVIVNNPGDWNTVYAPLLHAEWHGWTPTDLVFPFFLFAVGVAITLSSATAGQVGGIVRRGLIIFGLGLFLSGFPYFPVATWRIPGVLQRIAICYVVAALITRAIASQAAPRVAIRQMTGVVAVLLITYNVLLLAVPVPGGQAGDLTPAGNLGAWLDRTLMRGHLWRPDWDPEGLLSTLPAIATTLMGVIAGYARNRVSTSTWRRRLIGGGAAGVAVGLVWSLQFPINKSLWTSSYVMFTGGLAAIVLAACSWWADEQPAGWRAATSEPFVALGRNAILLFVLSGLVGRLMGVVLVDHAARVSVKAWIYATVFAPLASPKNASLLFALTNLAVLYALLATLHARRWYWKV